MLTKQERLRVELRKQISRFRRESDKHKCLYRNFRYIVFGLTGCATILASAALSFENHQTWLNLAVVFASACAGIVTSLEGLRKPSELWVHERNILYTLIDLEREIKFKIEELDAEKYFDKLQGILASSAVVWSNKVTSSDEKNP